MLLIIGICIAWFCLPTSLIFPLISKCVHLNRVSCSSGDHIRAITQTPPALRLIMDAVLHIRRLYSPHARSRRRPSLERPSFISDGGRPVCMLFAPWDRRRRRHTTDRILATKLRNVFMKFNERRRIVSSDCKPRHRLQQQQPISWMTERFSSWCVWWLQRTML